MTKDPFEIEHRWIHLQYTESTPFVETYGFSGNQGTVNLEGVLMTPRGCHSKSLLIYMHPSSTLQLLPVPRAAVRLGAHVLCAGSRYAKNDSSLIYEKVVLDLGAYVKYAKDTLRYEKIILVGWSGGGALTLFYQSQAERPDITHTPAGDPIDIRGSDLIPADAIVVQAAHYSRAQFLLDLLDPSVTNELDPDNRDSSLDLYDHANSHQLPYSPTFVSRYRQAQRARMDAITRWVKEMLYAIKRRPEVMSSVRSSRTAPWQTRVTLTPIWIPTTAARVGAIWVNLGSQIRPRPAWHDSLRCALGCPNGLSMTRAPMDLPARRESQYRC
jgi:hypothetical protein